MVIETPEGLTLVEPAENSSFYIVQEHEGHETPPGTCNYYNVRMLWWVSDSLVSFVTAQIA